MATQAQAAAARQCLYAERLWSDEEIANMSDEDAVLFAGMEEVQS